MSTLNLDWIRAQFPALAETVNGQPAIFFDGPGGTQVTQGVIDAIRQYLTHANANTHGAFLTSARTDHIIAEAHRAMADLLGCDAEEVVFGPNMTTLTFQLSRSFGRELQPGDEIVVTRLDHDANVTPWHTLEERGAVIRTVDIDVEDCTLDMADFAAQINERTKLVAVGYASNAVGTINDVQAVVAMARRVGALTFVDAVHYAPHGPIDVRELGCDFLACSPYKFFAPHMGALYGKREHLERLHPYKVRPAANTTPNRWQTGTQNHEAMAGVTAAVNYLADLGRRVQSAEGSDASRKSRRDSLLTAMTAIKMYERGLIERLIAGLLTIPGLTFYGIREQARFGMRTPTVSFRIEGHTPRTIAEYLGKQGIFVWDGNYYALSLTERLGVEANGGMVRVGLVHYNTAEEVERLLEALATLTRAGR
ncbi:MAG: cysteine desulfurase-like protein [Chloroflexales bacterium]|nr:cysteine desulfurase-like protein [Chloroflexales bacterium]